MPSTTPRKRTTLTKEQGQRQAAGIFKHGWSTSEWDENDAVQYFNMNKNVKTVCRSKKEDSVKVQWFKDENNFVDKRTLPNE